MHGPKGKALARSGAVALRATGGGGSVQAPIWPGLRARYTLLRFLQLPSRGGSCGGRRGWSSHGAASLFAAASCPARELPIKASAPTTARAARSEAERAERGAGQMRPCTPLTSASTPRESAFKPVPHPAAPVGQSSQTRRHHLTPTPVQQLCTPVQSCGQKRSFLLDRARPVFFSGKTERNGGCIPLDKPLAEQRFPRPPDGGPLQLPPVRPASQIIQRYAEMVRQGDQRVQAGPCSPDSKYW